MLAAKFDGAFTGTPATWMWSRLVRMKSTRAGASQKEASGHLIGGYITLIEAMTARILSAGGSVRLNSPVEEILISDGRVTGIRSKEGIWNAGPVVATMQAPVFSRLIPQAPDSYHTFLAATRYLGIVCPLVVLDRPLTEFWTVNITDPSVPFTGIVETTSYIDPSFVGGHHLVYVPKYTAPGSRWFEMSDDEVRDTWLTELSRMFPTFDRNRVRYFLVHRERFVDPIHPMRSLDRIPGVVTPVRDLFLATTAQIYPALTNGESVTRHAKEAAIVVKNAVVGRGHVSNN
jgi:protoporphyrinogen oxidase